MHNICFWPAAPFRTLELDNLFYESSIRGRAEYLASGRKGSQFQASFLEFQQFQKYFKILSHLHLVGLDFVTNTVNTAPVGFVNNLRSKWSLVACWVSLVAQMVKNLPAKQETRGSIPRGWEDSLEKGMATYSIILAWRIPWTEEPGRLLSMRSQRVGHD